jgi:multidrug resistance efflux pump
MANEGKAPFWAKLRNAKRRIRVLERSNQSLLRELEGQRSLCERLQAERDKADEHFSRTLALLESSTNEAAAANSCRYDFTGLAEHFDIAISLQQAQEEAAEAGSTLAMLSYETDLEQRSAFVHTVAQCLYEYTAMLKAIKVKGGAA